MHIIPTIVFPDGSILTEPTNAQLAKKMQFKIKAAHDFYDVIVIGGGPTGLTAAIYLAREGLEVLVIEKSGLGGQISSTQTVDNFPGFPDGISGGDFADRLVEQARRFGVEILQAQEVVRIHQAGPYHCLDMADGSEYTANAVLIATGAHYRRLGVPGEDELIGTNIHFCATCDGAFYKGKKVLVIGGGNSGFEEGLFLTRFASEVDIVDHSSKVKASNILQEKVREQPGMKVITNHAVKAFKGNSHLEGIVVEDRATGKENEWVYDGVFVYIGMSPNSELVQNYEMTDRAGFITTDATLMTSMPGIFAAGDVRASSTKQAAAAVGEGATAAIMIRDYLRRQGM